MMRANTLPAAATWLLALSFFLATSESPANTVVLLAHAQEQPTDCENISPTYIVLLRSIYDSGARYYARRTATWQQAVAAAAVQVVAVVVGEQSIL